MGQQPMKLALDDDTPLTANRQSHQKFQVAYCPQMISTMVLESVEGLLGDSVRPKHRRPKWKRRIASLFRTFFCSSSKPSERMINSARSFHNSTDWLLHHLSLSVGGGTTTSSVVKWYATFVMDSDTTPPEARLVVVAVCFDVNGSVAKVSGVTSSKSSFRVFGA
jgi:hypothetical protein